jgi:RNA polymerase-binding transcription factor DksA
MVKMNKKNRLAAGYERRLRRLLAELWQDEERLHREAVDQRDRGDAFTDLVSWMPSEGMLVDLLGRAERLRIQVADALERIQNGSFGTCTMCGCHIGRPRLDAIPYAETCIACASERPARPGPIASQGSDRPYAREHRRQGRRLARREARALAHAEAEALEHDESPEPDAADEI